MISKHTIGVYRGRFKGICSIVCELQYYELRKRICLTNYKITTSQKLK